MPNHDILEVNGLEQFWGGEVCSKPRLGLNKKVTFRGKWIIKLTYREKWVRK